MKTYLKGKIWRILGKFIKWKIMFSETPNQGGEKDDKHVELVSFWKRRLGRGSLRGSTLWGTYDRFCGTEH